jgi:cytochrome c-type biogenesis protein CcmH/NrfF
MKLCDRSTRRATSYAGNAGWPWKVARGRPDGIRCGRRLDGFPARRVRLAVLLACLSATLLVAGATEAQQRPQDRVNAAEARRAIDQLRSPYCPGFMLSVCTSYQAAALRDSIYDLAAEGMTSDELIDWMLSRHGEEWRAVPQRSGAGLWAWVIPPLALLAGLGVLVGWLRSSRTPGGEIAPPDDHLSEGDRERLATALREWAEVGEEEV